MQRKTSVGRRQFVRAALAGGAAALLPWPAAARAAQENGVKGGSAAGAPTEGGAVAAPGKEGPKVEYRTLGRTGLRVSTVGFGAMRTSEPAVIQRALDLGINYLDTACCYMDGNNEVIVGGALEGRRPGVVLATKVHIDSEEKMLASVERSLRRLRTEAVDVLQLHSVKKKGDVLHAGARQALEKARARGMTRFLGFTTHQGQAECLLAGAESKFFDMALVTYSYKTEPEIERAIAEAARAGMGVVAMKTQMGGYGGREAGGGTPHQAALRWVLRNPNVATTIPSMVSFEQVEENIGAMAAPFAVRDQALLDRHGREWDAKICRLCGRCDGQCPAGLPLQEVSRGLMYAEGYGDWDLALRTLRALAPAIPATACHDCGRCPVECAHGLDLPARLARARGLLAALAG